MRLETIVTLVLAYARASSARGSRVQQGPIDPGTNPDCTFYDTAYSEADDCAYFEEFWGITHEEFVSWNPLVGEDCSGIKVGNSYCVEAPSSTVTRTTTTSTTTTSGGAGPTNPPKPSPTQPGLIESCVSFYKAVSGDTCDSIVSQHRTFTAAQFIEWNPAVGTDCRSLWAETWYCVGIPGTPTSPPTTLTTTTTTGVPKPSPTQPGLIDSCVRFYKAVSGDTCDAIISKHGGVFTFAQFFAWNPAVGSECRNLWAETYYCVGIPGTPTTTTTTRPTSTTTGNGVATPTPTQPNMVKNCDRFYFVKPDDTCFFIAHSHGISQAQLNIWNPSIGSGTSCGGLWSNAYVCVRTIGFQPPVTQTCHSSGKTWGDNRPAAHEAALDWCRDTSSRGGSGTYAKGLTKAGCRNAPFGNNLFSFEMVNEWETSKSLTADRCNEILRLPINRCDRGGIFGTESWQVRAKVIEGRC